VARNCEAQGDVGARQRRHVLSSPRVIDVEESSRSVVGRGMPSRERVGDWAGKEEVSKEERKRKRTSRMVSRRTAQRQGMLHDLAKKTEQGTNKAQLNPDSAWLNFELQRSTFNISGHLIQQQAFCFLVNIANQGICIDG